MKLPDQVSLPEERKGESGKMDCGESVHYSMLGVLYLSSSVEPSAELKLNTKASLPLPHLPDPSFQYFEGMVLRLPNLILTFLVRFERSRTRTT